MDNRSDIARDVVVRGMVQGVSYRWTTQQEAERLHVRGWVRNEPDGSVRAHLEGEPEQVAELVAWMRQGPSGAQVESVDEQQGEVEGVSGFRAE
ncbi:acylphosphatase [Nocardioides rotundus]|uniref:acylphosphatase n=1 Tax=Nocardioides rotundus TaxID=1774216 RepID=UPI001CBAD1CD|nr:acylphosphatase [Nocardioides rotundus]UAL29248.1 acylphosphatase [Nocardioides rotundus]